MSISHPLSWLSSFKHFHISVQATTMILEFHFPFFLNLFSFSRLLFFLSTLLYGVFFNIFWIYILLSTPMARKKNPRTFFPLKIKSSEKQKCVKKLFLSKSKILKRLNHRISENWKIVIRKLAIFSSGIIFTEKLFFNSFSYYNFANFLWFFDSIFKNF